MRTLRTPDCAGWKNAWSEGLYSFSRGKERSVYSDSWKEELITDDEVGGPTHDLRCNFEAATSASGRIRVERGTRGQVPSASTRKLSRRLGGVCASCTQEARFPPLLHAGLNPLREKVGGRAQRRRSESSSHLKNGSAPPTSSLACASWRINSSMALARPE